MASPARTPPAERRAGKQRRKTARSKCRRCVNGFRPTGVVVHGPGGETGIEVVPCECGTARRLG